jgi:hypothetical protein
MRVQFPRENSIQSATSERILHAASIGLHGTIFDASDVACVAAMGDTIEAEDLGVASVRLHPLTSVRDSDRTQPTRASTPT